MIVMELSIGSAPLVQKGVKHENIRENAIQEACLQNEISIHHIPGVSNPAELFTEELKSDTLFHTLHGLILCYPSSFTRSSVSCLDWSVTLLLSLLFHFIFS
jgi:hypothetical protein